VTRLPIAPPPQPDEALSSWIARIAARYDLAADDLVQYLLPNETDVSGMARWIDVCPWPPLEDALAAATNRPRAHIAERRLAGLAVNPDAAWPRNTPAWCPLCVSQDVAAYSEVYSRKAWTFGGYLICPQHRSLLIASCPLCLRHVAYRPVNGRLRLWCEQCDRCADNALAPRQIPFWPFGTPQQHRRCRTIRLTAEAKPLLLRVQSDLLAALCGARSKEPWARDLKPARLIAVLRQLVFVMLGPLWEDAYRFQHRYWGIDPPWSLPDDWTPGSLPPEIAAPALLASVTFLAAERRTRLEGITWNPRLLLAGEGDRIEATTLIWHLSATDAEWVRHLFGAPVGRPFAVLLAALRGNHRSLGAMREAARRRQGVGGAERRIRDNERRRTTETEAARMKRERREQRETSSQRFAIGRLIDGYVAPAKPRLSRTQIDASFAVYAMRGAGTSADGVPAGCEHTLLGNRYIRLWLARHRHVPAPQLIATLVTALETERSEEHGLVLPELSAASPATTAAP
jgi:hypothetical protein